MVAGCENGWRALSLFNAEIAEIAETLFATKDTEHTKVTFDWFGPRSGPGRMGRTCEDKPEECSSGLSSRVGPMRRRRRRPSRTGSLGDPGDLCVDEPRVLSRLSGALDTGGACSRGRWRG